MEDAGEDVRSRFGSMLGSTIIPLGTFVGMGGVLSFVKEGWEFLV